MLSSLFALFAPSVLLEPSRSDYLLALAPTESFLVVTVNDLSGIRSATAKNAWFRFLRDEQVSALVEHITQPLAAELDGVDLEGLKKLEIDPRAFLASLSGSVVLFAEAPSNNPDDMLLGLLFEIGEDRTAFDELLGKVLEAARDEANVTGRDYGGAALTVIEPKEESEAGIAFIAELGDVVAIVGGADAALATDRIQGVVDRWGGTIEGSNVLENENFRAARSAQSFSPQVEVFFDFGRFWDLTRATGALEGEGFPPRLADEIGRIRWLQLGARIGQDESFDLRVASSFPEEGVLGGLASLFGSLPTSLVRRAPRQSACLSALSMDVAGLSEWIQDLAQEFDASRYEDMQAHLEAAKEKGVDVEGDLLAQLTGEIASFSVEVPPNESPLGALSAMMRGIEGSSQLPTFGSAFLVGIRDPVRVREILASWMEEERAPVAGDAPDSIAAPAIETFNGFEIHSAKVFEGFIPIGIHWSVTDHALIVGMQPTAVREALRMFDENAMSVMENRRFGEVIEENKEALALQIWSSADAIKSVLGLLQTAVTGLHFYSALSGDERLDGLPFGKDVPWPRPSIVDGYFEGIVFSAIRLREGTFELHLAAR